MTAIDVIIIVFAAFFGLVGFSRGFVIGALSLIGFAGGAYLGTRFGPHLLKEGNASPFAPLLGLIGALIGGVVLSGFAESIGGAVRSGIRSRAFGLFDGLLGSALAIALALGLAWLVSVIVLQTPGVREYRASIQRSVILKKLNTVLPSDRVLKALARFDPFPSVTRARHRGAPAARLGRGRSGHRGRGAVGRARAVQLVRAGRRRVGLGGGAGHRRDECPCRGRFRQHLGGAQRLRMTGSTPRRSPSTRARTSRSCACRRSTGPRCGSRARSSRPSPARCSASRSTVPYQALPARVGRTAPVLANDAYGRRLVRKRSRPFRADVKPGNSGGPVVDVAGRVSGTIFSKLLGSNGGYAVPNATVRDALAGAGGPVDTGPCTH